MIKNQKPQHYSDYLQLDVLLNAQRPASLALGDEKHDEMLFIVVHQAHELWFKQILHEVDSILAIFAHKQIDDLTLLTLARRLHRIHTIQQILLKQLTALNTLTPMEFLDFRDMLMPASGFQSLQFRLLEIKLGSDKKQLLHTLSSPEKSAIAAAQQQPNLKQELSRWLERTPFLKSDNFTFWRAYQQQVSHHLNSDIKNVKANPYLSEKEKQTRIKEIKAMLSRFEMFFDRSAYQTLLNKGERHMSFEASQAALFIFLYRDQPALQVPYQILSQLIQMDQNLVSWKSHHLLMVQRIIGGKMGTGGSAGVAYLSQGAQSQVFADLTALSTFMLPSSCLPSLPEALIQQLGFYDAARG